MTWFLLIGGAAIGLALVALLIGGLLQVDDWSRDLSVNQAETTADHADQRLRPLTVQASPDATAQLLTNVVRDLPGWRLESQETAPDGAVTLHCTRTTRLWRFVDDVEVRVELAEKSPVPGADVASVVRVASRSRIGQGDLGQNPRNIRELLDGLRALLP